MDQVTRQLPEYQFSNHFIAGAGELVVDSILKNSQGSSVTLRIFSRTTGSIQLALMGNGKFQKNCLAQHFFDLQNLPIGRNDFIHIPEVWKKKGITYSVDEAVKRAKLLIEFFNYDLNWKPSEELKKLILQQRKLSLRES